ncbi:hypothetical protein LCGC14_1369630 [marine sediment metagenome]|uniref:N-terminal domain-containing protein n=1 Tax=marine sediment metagenome TaxID=412755 RepID=A0A0F9MKZ7_9ZZZZ
MTRAEREQEALGRARASLSLGNYRVIYLGFMDKGIAKDDIKPRDNVLTFHAWRALGRTVKKGEHGVSVVTFIPIKGKEKDKAGLEVEVERRRMKAATVFHISQTKELNGGTG